MNTLSPEQIHSMVREAEKIAAHGDFDGAAQKFQQILRLTPNQPRALNFFAMREFVKGEHRDALQLIENALITGSKIALLHANHGRILREMKNFSAAIAAFDRAIVLDPQFLPAIFDKALTYESLGQEKQAARFFKQVILLMPNGVNPASELGQMALHAQKSISRDTELLEHFLVEKIGHGAFNPSQNKLKRFQEFADIALQRKAVYQSRPTSLYFPGLPNISIYENADFSWVPIVEAATESVKSEIIEVVRSGSDGVKPYVNMGAGEVVAQWQELNQKLDWGAYFLWDRGKKIEAHCERCPQTSAMLDTLPLMQTPMRAPSAFFSMLKPRTHIPPHPGALNFRLTVHLPLIIPNGGCAIRVGNDLHYWQSGKVLIFDDTIEHEAWNPTDELRVVLIFDVWHPMLKPFERELVSQFIQNFVEYYGDSAPDMSM